MSPTPYPFDRWPRLHRDTLRTHALGRRLTARLTALIDALCHTLSEHALDAHLVGTPDWSTTTRDALPEVDAAISSYLARLEIDDHPSVLRIGGAVASAITESLTAASPTSGRLLTEIETALLDRLLLSALFRSPTPLLLSASGNGLSSLLRTLRSSTPLITLRFTLEIQTPDGSRIRSNLDWTTTISDAAAWLTTHPSPRNHGATLPPWLLSAMELSVCAGWLDLDRGTARQLTPGDLILPAPLTLSRSDTTLAPVWLTPPNAAVALPATLHLGPTLGVQLSHNAPIQELTVTDPTQPTPNLEAALRQAPVQLRVEIGRVALSAERVARLEAGELLELSSTLGDPVTLLIGNTPVGTAELVDIDGTVGIRILTIGDA